MDDGSWFHASVNDRSPNFVLSRGLTKSLESAERSLSRYDADRGLCMTSEIYAGLFPLCAAYISGCE